MLEAEHLPEKGREKEKQGRKGAREEDKGEGVGGKWQPGGAEG